MRRLLSGFRGQLRRILLERRFRVLLVMLVALSCVSVGIYRWQVLRDMPVAVVDLDNSTASRRISEFLGAMREVRLTGDFIGSTDDARRLMADGTVTAVVLIPSDFSSALKRGEKGDVLVAVDMSNILVGKNVQKAVAKAVGTVGAGVQLTTVQKLGLRGDRAMSAVVPVAVDESLTFNPATNYSVYIVPSLLFFLLHVYAVVLGTSVVLPGQAPGSALEKAGAGAAVRAVCLVLGAGMLWVLLPWARIEPVASAPVLLALVAGLLALDLAFVAAVFAVTPSSLLAMELTVAVAMLSLMLSGITWPADLFPPWLQVAAAWVPLTPFARGLRTLVHGPAAVSDASPWLLALARQVALFGSVGLVMPYFGWGGPHRLAVFGLFVAFCAAIVPAAILVCSVVRDRYAAFQVLLLVSAPAFLMSGFSWPLDQMPGIVRGLASTLPSTPALLALRTLSMKSGDLQSIAPCLAWMAGLGFA